MRNFEDRVFVITGAGSGLGRSLAIQAAAEDARLGLCDLDLEGLRQTRDLTGLPTERVLIAQVDVTDKAAMQAFADEVTTAFGQVDVLINNAGISLTPNLFLDIPDALFKKVVDVNMWGVYNGTRAFLSHLQQREEAAIVNVSSLAGLVGLYGYTPYAMSKFAVRALAEALQMELVGSGITVLVVHPGGVKTDLIKNAPDLADEERELSHDLFTRAAFMTAEKAAEKILEAIKKKRRRLIIGTDAKLVFAFRKLFPRRYPEMLKVMFSQMNFRGERD